jgi:hypothetical protein
MVFKKKGKSNKKKKDKAIIWLNIPIKGLATIPLSIPKLKDIPYI